MASIFTKIVRGEIPSFKVAEDERFYAFLDIFPLQKGHCLVIPKKEVDYIYDLDDQELADLHVFAKKVALGIEKAVSCARVGVAVIGLEVPHAHIHLIPINQISDMSFENEKLSIEKEEMKLIAERISEAIEL